MKFLGGFLALFGGYTGYISIQPRLEIETIIPSFRGNFPSFSISNAGYTSLFGVKFDCGAKARVYFGDLPRTRVGIDDKKSDALYSDIGMLSAGEKVIRSCPKVQLPPGTNLSPGTIVYPIVSYRSYLWPFEINKLTIFHLRGDESMQWYWDFEGSGISDDQLKSLHKNGYNVDNLRWLNENWNEQ
jgi:hypothetical protein